MAWDLDSIGRLVSKCDGMRAFFRRHILIAFFVMAFVLSWYPWIIALMRGRTSGPNPLGPIRRCHYHDRRRIRSLGIPGIFQPTRALAIRGKGICHRFHDTDPDLLDRGWHHTLLHVATFHFADRKIARSAGTFSLHFPVHRTWRRARLARFRSAAVTDKIFSLDRESHSRIGLGALASAAGWK